jgi:Ion channel
MLSLVLMIRRVVRAWSDAAHETELVPVVSAGVALVCIGTATYATGAGWGLIDALYFAVATLTTTNVADPALVLDHAWLKVSTVLYLLVGIGVLVELLRRLGAAFVAVRTTRGRA